MNSASRTDRKPTCSDLTILAWSGSDATVTWTADGIEHRAVVCVEVEDDGCIAYGGDDVPDEVEAYLAYPAKERHQLARRDDDSYAPERGDLETWGQL